jgi:hypothetical protein
MNVLARFRLSSIVRFFHLVKGMHVQPYQLMSGIIDCQVDYVMFETLGRRQLHRN